MKGIGQKIIIWFFIVFGLVAFYHQFIGNEDDMVGKNIYFSDFMDQLYNNNIEEVKISKSGGEMIGTFKNGVKFKTNMVFYDSLVQDLRKHDVKFKVVSSESIMGIFGSILITWLPMIILVGIWVFFIKQMQSGSNKAMSFGKSKARMTDGGKTNITFNDVAGIDEAKEELAEMVDFLKDPKKFKSIGAKIPRGCLLVGAPGTGKTLLAKAIAGEAAVHFFNISGSDFVEMFVGVGASRVRDMFESAKKHSPCIVFIDEIDAVGRHRGVGIGGGNDEREQTLNQLLVEMDGFESSSGIIVIAATNRPDVLDPALLRPGRFDRRITVPMPDIRGREQILSIHAKNIISSPDISIPIIAKSTPGFSGADLANLVNEAALYAAKNNKKLVSMSDMEYAKDKVMMGVERKSMILSDLERKITAYHEAGHAIAALFVKNSDKLYKITIIPRGQALGLVMRLPDDDRISVSKARLLADIKVAVAGRVAEEIVFGEDNMTSGASSDIKRATEIARAMVSQWGMSDVIGNFYCHNDSIEEHQNFSEDTKKQIDSEVKKIISDSREEIFKLLKAKRKSLDLLVEHLLKYETLNFDQVEKIMKGKRVSEDEFSIVDKNDEVHSSFAIPNSNSDADDEPDDKKIKKNKTSIKQVRNKANKKKADNKNNKKNEDIIEVDDSIDKPD